LSTTPVWLLDANLLIALTHAAHVHHAEAHRWFAARTKRRWASCALTQLAFLRLTSNPKVVGEQISPAEAMQALATMTAQPQHEYWPDAPAPEQMTTLNSPALVGHRQISDAYLLGLAAHKRQRLATLDRGLLSFAAAQGLAAHVELVSAQAMVQEPAARYAVSRTRR
jgi:toxin-antitoxin system PIN domain toxin